MKAKLQDAVKTAMKERNKIKVETLRSILTAMQYEEISKKVEELPADAVLAIMQRELKKRKEELEFAEQANRPEQIEKIAVEMAVIEEFLPKQLTSEELEKIITELKSKSEKPNVGVIMKGLQETFGGQYDGKAASEIVRRVIGS